MALHLDSAKNIFISLSELQPEKFFVVIDERFNEKLINKLIFKYGSIPKAALELQIPWASIYNWKKSNQYPLHYLTLILSSLNFDFKYLERNLVAIKSGFNWKSKGGGLSKPLYPKFPILISKELIRIIAHLFGDGCISLNKKKQITAAYYNQEYLLRKQFKKDIRFVFGDIYLSEGINKTTPFVSIPAPIAFILLSKINSFGSDNFEIPLFIKNSDKALRKEFLKSLFDDECHVEYNPPQRRIEFALCNHKAVLDVKKLLEEFNINITPVYFRCDDEGYMKYYFYIRNYHNLYNFYKNIGLNHPNKLKNLISIIKNPGRKSYARGETKLLILALISKKDSTSTDLLIALNRKRVTINYWLSKLEVDGKIYRKEIRNLKKGIEIIWSLRK